jgi:hypothetical protein
MFIGQREINWTDLPQNDVTLVPGALPVRERGIEFKLVEQLQVPRPEWWGTSSEQLFKYFRWRRLQSVNRY